MRGYLYVIARQADAKQDIYKLGLTIYPEHRLRQYITGDRPGDEHSYYGLWLTKANTRDQLKQMESTLHYKFREFRLKRINGSNTEWFHIPFNTIAEYLGTAPFIQSRIPNELISQIQEKAYKPTQTKEEYIEVKEELDTGLEITEFTSLYQKCIETFLPPAGQFRKHQEELWYLFNAICETDAPLKYRGIIQWPTGTGKTFAILITLLLSFERCKRMGRVFRALLISPKNDIFDTIIKHIRKLEEFGIQVYEGHGGGLADLTISSNSNFLITASHAVMTKEDTFQKIPPLTHIHYDEVHRIGGSTFFSLLTKYLDIWQPDVLLGTSATPRTADPEQHKKLYELFGEDLSLLHKVEVDQAVQEKWIAVPRFHVLMLEKHLDIATILERYVDGCVEKVLQKTSSGKSIFYIESSIDHVEYAVKYARRKYPSLQFYAAIDSERTDDSFQEVDPTSNYHILFACQRYREGSDIKGLESTGTLVFGKKAAHTLIQISGRALRMDYPNKEGWCIIAKPCEEGETYEDVLDSIVLEVLNYLGTTSKPLNKTDIEKLVKTYFGHLNLAGVRCTLEETVSRIQAAYSRIEFSKRTPKEKYSLIQAYNKEFNFKTKEEYLQSSNVHPKFIGDPKKYFDTVWQNWYHFLGVDTSSFPQTKSGWVRMCKDRGIIHWEQYKVISSDDMPKNPGEMYEDFTNWDKEFGVEEEIVW